MQESTDRLLIATNKAVLRLDADGELTTLYREPNGFLVPRSILLANKNIYVGMRGFILRLKPSPTIANLATPESGSPVQGAEYSYDCERGFITNSQLDSFYPARWTHPGQTLELLLQRPGSNSVDRCIVTVSLRPEPFPQASAKAQKP